MGTRVTLTDNVPARLDGTAVVAGYFWRDADGDAQCHLERPGHETEPPRPVRLGDQVEVDGHLWRVVQLQLRRYVRDWSAGGTVTLELVDEPE